VSRDKNIKTRIKNETWKLELKQNMGTRIQNKTWKPGSNIKFGD
jgi:uncharacterized protein YaaW (UPF0174 family)